jgi:hypothetical protein
VTTSSDDGYELLLRLPANGPGMRTSLPELDHRSAPWEANAQATGECLSLRGALDNLERRQAEDELGERLYRALPVHTRTAVVTAHALLERGAISESELEAKMQEVRRRFASGQA